MRVIHVVPSVARRTGGPAVVVLEASTALRTLGLESIVYATDLAAPAGAGETIRASASAPGVHIFPTRRPYRLAYSPQLGRALAAAVAGADVVHIHSLYLYPQFAAFREAVRRNVPYVVSPRGALDPFLRSRGRARKSVADKVWQRRMLDGAAALHVTSHGEAELIEDVAPSVRRVVVPNGLNWEEFQRPAEGERFRDTKLGGHRGPVVLFLGRLSFKKGLDVLVSAFARVASETEDVVLAIAGPDDEGLQASLKQLANRLDIGSRVRFTGMLDRSASLDALAAADVWALPSHTENFGLALAEALAAGVATIVSPAVNIAADVEGAGAGLVCQANPDILANELLGLLRDETRRAEFGRRAREFARRYDWSGVAPELASVYAEAAA